jgi:hypothetical protein
MVVEVDHFDKHIGTATSAQNADFVLAHGAIQFRHVNIFNASFGGESIWNL